jgi:hypothetical protein
LNDVVCRPCKKGHKVPSEEVREFVTGNEILRIVAHRCIIEASIGKRIVQAIEATIEQHTRGNIVQAIGSNIGIIVHIEA